MRWDGFRKVRRQVCKRIKNRISELELPGFRAYQEYLLSHPSEWRQLDSLCFITISRFYRDKKVFQILQHQILSSLAMQVSAAERPVLEIWSAGCCSGEEAYTIKILWEIEVKHNLKSEIDMHIIATDNSNQLLRRAEAGEYTAGSLKALPDHLLREAFYFKHQNYHIKPFLKEGILFRQQDIRQKLPDQMFNLILCRNLVFTYFEKKLQKEILDRLVKRLKYGGFLIIGSHEKLPVQHSNLNPYENSDLIFKKTGFK
jgi:chemotaxis protein methyltransferase CheR